MPQAVSEYCVYTIKEGKRLVQIAESGKKARFEERRSWVTARKLWQKAREAEQAMPLLLGDAADCSRLLFWGLLTDLRVAEGGTSFTVDRLRRLPGQHAPQELILRSRKKPIAPNFIRPYAICVTPAFVKNASLR